MGWWKGWKRGGRGGTGRGGTSATPTNPSNGGSTAPAEPRSDPTVTAESQQGNSMLKVDRPLTDSEKKGLALYYKTGDSVEKVANRFRLSRSRLTQAVDSGESQVSNLGFSHKFAHLH